MININRKKSISNAILIFAALSSLLGVSAAAAEAPPSPVRVVEVKKNEISPTADIMGTVYSRNEVQLTAGVTGRLEWVAEPGTYLQKDDLVAQIELLPLQLRQAEQSAQLKRAKINLRYLARELDRQKELAETHSASQFQLEQTESQYELAKSDLEIADLKLKQINDQLSRASIHSPFDGVVTKRQRRAGFDVNGSDVIVQMLDTQSLEVRLSVPVKYLAFTKPGSAVVLTSRSETGETLSVNAEAKTIIPTADPLSQTFEVRINLPGQGLEYWAAGQLVKVSIPIEAKRTTLAVHRDALILRREGTYVVKIDDNNVAHRLKVKVGKGKGDWVSIEGDIQQGDKVATRGAERLQEGQKVIVQAAEV